MHGAKSNGLSNMVTGNKLRACFAAYIWAPHEILWLKAALTLSCGPRCVAYRDIVELTGRTLKAVQSRAKRAHNEDAIAAAWAADGYYARTVMVPERSCDRLAQLRRAA